MLTNNHFYFELSSQEATISYLQDKISQMIAQIVEKSCRRILTEKLLVIYVKGLKINAG